MRVRGGRGSWRSGWRCWPLRTEAAPPYKAGDAVKLDVLGEWAHPDDDTSIIGPCGVWHDRYGVRCGIIMVTRGEGGGNAVGTEIGPALGLRRENEDRVAHFRSGTVDIFNLDRVDFFYNKSAPLTQFFWGEDETLRRITRIIRMTQPEIYIGFTPSLNFGPRQPPAGRPLHLGGRQGGRRPDDVPRAAARPARAAHVAGQEGLLRRRRTAAPAARRPRRTARPASSRQRRTSTTVAGVWTGYDSPYDWPAGNVQGKPAGSPKSWAQVAQEGARALPDAEPHDVHGPRRRRAARASADRRLRAVPAERDSERAAGRDDAILYGAVKQDPGGLPLGTLEHIELSDFFSAPGKPFQATVHVRSGKGTLPRGTVELTAPDGWTVEPREAASGRSPRAATRP